jgi:hypothetical protein
MQYIGTQSAASKASENVDTAKKSSQHQGTTHQGKITHDDRALGFA